MLCRFRHSFSKSKQHRQDILSRCFLPLANHKITPNFGTYFVVPAIYHRNQLKMTDFGNKLRDLAFPEIAIHRKGV